mmetsp:Transcript_84212/g.250941  ORF Transcript_84212/g.250941 Transcript_84212/m.250941 type:complete len:254 (-) Transcript_84212:307-1068(-)
MPLRPVAHAARPPLHRRVVCAVTQCNCRGQRRQVGWRKEFAAAAPPAAAAVAGSAAGTFLSCPLTVAMAAIREARHLLERRQVCCPSWQGHHCGHRALGRGRPKLQLDAERVVIAAAVAEVLGGEDCTAQGVAEDAVNAATNTAVEDVCEVSPEERQGLGGSGRVEVAEKHHGVAGHRVLPDGAQDVSCSGLATAEAARVDGQGPVVVHDKQLVLRASVGQTHPLHSPLPEVLPGNSCVLCDDLDALCKEIPS